MRILVVEDEVKLAKNIKAGLLEQGWAVDTAFDGEEKKMLDRVIMRYGHLNGKQLEELSHAEAPYIGTELRKDIPYELAFYRGTDFSEL